MTDITIIKRACEVLRAEGYNDAAQYLSTWAAMPSALRDVYPLHDVTPPERNPPTAAEIAERLAKVEQRQDEFERRTIKALNAHDERFDTQSELRVRSSRALDQRIDKVAEIIGERVSGLVDRMTVIENGDAQDYDYVLKGLDEVRLRAGLGTMQAEHPRGGPAFPTGGADTAEAAAEAVLPVPQRGDRVRLEGARTTAHYSVPDGWHEVVGQSGDAFQVRLPQIGGDWLPYIPNETTGLKEVKANAST